VRGAKSINYVGAGTIEMLLDTDGSFYFMEMNNPHPGGASGHRDAHRRRPGEGADRVAAGEPMREKGRPPQLRRHVIECRECQTRSRTSSRRRERSRSFTCRAATACAPTRSAYAGYIGAPFYDSMIAEDHLHGAGPRRGARQDAPRARHLHRPGRDDDHSVPEERLMSHPDFKVRRGSEYTRAVPGHRSSPG